MHLRQILVLLITLVPLALVQQRSSAADPSGDQQWQLETRRRVAVFKGNHEHANWVALSGNIDGEPVCIAVLSHTNNFRSPQAARLHPSKPYFCFSPCVDGAFTIDRDHPFQGRYRFLIADTKPDSKWIDRQWETWCNE